jgi:fumarate hydratase class I
MSKPISLRTPLKREDTAQLKAGQAVLISGMVITARDAAHRYLASRADSDGMPFDLRGAVIYHCGPLMRQSGSKWEAVSAGPTTSARMEMYEAKVIERYGIAAVIGKGGMGPATASALAKTGAVYLAAAAGAGALLAKRIVAVNAVWKLEEFGEPEAMWQLEVSALPAIVAMDGHGGDLYKDVQAKSRDALKRLLGAAPAQSA